jgi:methionine-rich copper-binding protein CopC
MKSVLKSTRACVPTLACLTAGLGLVFSAAAEPYVVSSVPANGATGVSPTDAVIFTFNEPMNPQLTAANFVDFTDPFQVIVTTDSWSENNTKLTCVPSPSFPANKVIYWTVDGESANGEPTSGTDYGFFTTGGGGGSGSGTNALTSFSVGITHYYNQTNTVAPTLDPEYPYNFGASTILASNRTANSITVTLPTGSISNLAPNPFRPELYSLFATRTNLTTFNTTFPSGNYVFNVQATASNQTVTVNLPSSLTQPAAPRISNFAAAQSVVATQSFQLTWDAFPGGTSADRIYVEVGGVFQTPDFDATGALNGTATSVTIPANTLQPNSNYVATVGFYRFVTASNASYTTVAYRATVTEFDLITGSGIPGGPLVLTNGAWSAGRFGFDIKSAAGQTFTILYSSNLLSGEWYPLLTTNSPSGILRVSDPRSTTNRVLFYRARNGS